MSITIYKLTSHIDWESTGVGVTFSGGGTGGSIPIGGLNGTSFPNQVTYWLDGDTLAGDEGFIYEVDSAGIGILGVNYIRGIGDSSGANSVLYLHGDSLYLGDIAGGCLPAKTSEIYVVYYDDATGKLSYGLGEDTLWEEDSIGDLYTITAGAGIYVDGLFIKNNSVIAESTDLILKAGATNYVYIVPGDYGGNGTIFFGDASSTCAALFFMAEGTLANIELVFNSKGSGGIMFYSPAGGQITFQSTVSVNCGTPLVQVGDNNGVALIAAVPSATHGYPLTIRGGDGIDVFAEGLNLNGGNLLLQGGLPAGTGITGKIYIGTGSAGTNPLAEADSAIAHVLMYDTATGEVTFGDK